MAKKMQTTSDDMVAIEKRMAALESHMLNLDSENINHWHEFQTEKDVDYHRLDRYISYLNRDIQKLASPFSWFGRFRVWVRRRWYRTARRVKVRYWKAIGKKVNE